jgi:hypothetical protein
MSNKGGRVGWFVIAWGVAGCGHHDVSLKFPDSSPGEEYVCYGGGTGAEACSPQGATNPAKDNREGTVYVVVPRACKGHFNEVTIHDAGSSKPIINVKCAPLENKVQ